MQCRSEMQFVVKQKTNQFLISDEKKYRLEFISENKTPIIPLQQIYQFMRFISRFEACSIIKLCQYRFLSKNNPFLYNNQYITLKPLLKMDMKEQSQNQLELSDELYIPQKEKQLIKKFRKWTHQENQRYVVYLELNKESFQTQYLRRITKVFKGLSKAVRTKGQSQCKSHHQKMMQKFHNDIDLAISSMKVALEIDIQTIALTQAGDKIFLNQHEQIPLKIFDSKSPQEEIFNVLSLSKQQDTN